MKLLWLIRSESYKKGMLLSVIFNGISKAVLFLLTIVIAHYFGSSIKTDIYFFIYSTMILLAGFVNAVDIAVLIPESMRIREQEGAQNATAFLNYFLRLYFFIGILFVAIMFFFGTTVFGAISRFSAADILACRNYFLLGSFYFLFQVLTNYINNVLTSLKYFTLPMIISGVNSCIIIICIILLHSQFDVLSILTGGIVAYSINLVALLFVLKKATAFHTIKCSLKDSKKISRNILYTSMGQLVTTAGSYFPLYLLSGFNSGVISALSYGKNLADVPNTLLTAQLANVNGIQLNEQAAAHDLAGMNKVFFSTVKFLVFVLVPIGFFMFIFATPIVKFFYERGNFTAADIDGAATFMQLLAVTVFSVGVNAVVARVFIAMQAIRQAFIYQVIINILLLSATWLLVKYYGAYGYGYGVVAINILNYMLMYFACKKITPHINYAALMKYTLLIVFINAGIGTALWFAKPYLPANVLLLLATGFLTWIIALAAMNKLLHLSINYRLIFKKDDNSAT